MSKPSKFSFTKMFGKGKNESSFLQMDALLNSKTNKDKAGKSTDGSTPTEGSPVKQNTPYLSGAVCASPPIVTMEPKFAVNSFVIPEHYRPYFDKVYFTRNMMKDRCDKMAEDIMLTYSGAKEIHLVCVMKGARVFFEVLFQALQERRMLCDNPPMFREQYVQLSSLGIGLEKKEKSEFIGNLSVIAGKDVLLVEDIIDSGASLTQLKELLKSHDAKSVQAAVLVHIVNDAANGEKAEYVAFVAPSFFPSGMGFDINQHMRDMPHCGFLNEKGRNHFLPMKFP